MNHADQQLFRFFKDLSYIVCNLEYSHLPNLRNKITEAKLLLEQKKYSCINVQDGKGNSFLHKVCHQFIEEINKKGFVEDINKNLYCQFIFTLLEHGADPMLDNNFHNVPFNSQVKYYVLKHYYDIDIKNFSVRTKNFHRNFKQIILEQMYNDGNITLPSKDIKQFLENNELFTLDNYIHIFFHSSQILARKKMYPTSDALLTDSLSCCSNLNTNNTNNTDIVYLIFKSFPIHLFQQSQESKQLLYSFLHHKPLEYNVKLVDLLCYGDLFYNYHRNEFCENAIKEIVYNLALQKVDLHTTFEGKIGIFTIFDRLDNEQISILKELYNHYSSQVSLVEKLNNENSFMQKSSHIKHKI